MPTIVASKEVPDNVKCAAAVRSERILARMSMRELARRMDISAPYLGDLELGRRSWNEFRYKQAMHIISMCRKTTTKPNGKRKVNKL